MKAFIVTAGLVAIILLRSAAAGPLADATVEPVASARYCYAGLFPVYDAYYYRNAVVDADLGAATCIRLAYQRDISADSLARATRAAFAREHGEERGRQFENELNRLEGFYRDVDQEQGYTYCLSASGAGLLYHDSEAVLPLNEPDFARRYLQIWVKDEKQGQPVWTFHDCG